MFNPTVVKLLRLLAARPGGGSRREALQELGGTAQVERALARLQELGVVELRDDLVMPLAPLFPLAEKMEKLARRINRVGSERDQAMALVKLLFHGP